MLALIARRLVALWGGRKKKLPGSRLHIRLVYAFSILAAAPVIVMTIASALFFHFGIQTWFSERVRTAIEESNAVAVAYFDEHRQVIRADILAMANDLDRAAQFFITDQGAFDQSVQTQSVLRNFSEVIVFDLSGRILSRSGLTFSLEFENIPEYMLRQADSGDVVISTGGNEDRIRALTKLNNFTNTYLYVGRMVDPKVLSHLADTREAAKDYADLRARYFSFQIKVTLIFVVVGFILLALAIWYGLILARQIVTPIGALIDATERVRAGDLMARAPGDKNLEEFDYLAGAFNRMTSQIESVLRGVSSGVIGVNADGQVHLANASAIELLGMAEGELTGASIKTILPEIANILDQAYTRAGKTTQAEIPFSRKNSIKRILLARIVIHGKDTGDSGAILTFDDITELQSAQRKAAWADVARRIAHEIKNPLTPIQLSAERLRRKYLKQITDDPETFSQYTDTIVRNVEDIGRMVNEFSSFARMPEPVFKRGDLKRDIDEAVFLHRQAHRDIGFNILATDSRGYIAPYDSQQIRQVLNNLIQNAADSIHSRMAQDKDKGMEPIRGAINIIASYYGDDEISIAVVDNGTGLPADVTPSSLSEPYVTHKPKGTGLGLAIVKKIMEDHGGSLLIGAPDWLQSNPDWQDIGGACIVVLLPLGNKQSEIIAA